VIPPPPGFQRIAIPSGFAAEFGPMFVVREGDRVRLGFRVEESHLDERGTCHGGALATFADMQLAALQRTGAYPLLHCPTVSLAVDYFAPARLGDWVECEIALVDNARRLAFTQTVPRVGDSAIARSTALYTIAPPRDPAARPAPPEASARIGTEPPPGFSRLKHLEVGFGERFGPVFANAGTLGFRVAPVHVNIWGACHGGALATLAHAQIEALRAQGATPEGTGEAINLSIDYIAPARLGDWVQCEVTLVKATRRFLFTQGVLTCRGAPLARATAVYAGPGLSGS
jgi:acyl-coenzyme A thioesterase PaaI-like protein